PPRPHQAARAGRGRGESPARHGSAQPRGRAGRKESVTPPTVLGANNYHYLRGGSERAFLDTGRLLSARGHRVVHLSTAHPRNLPPPGPAAFVAPNDLARPGPADVVRFHWSRRAARALEELMRSERIRLAHLHIYYGQLTPAILAPLARARIPIVQTLHEYKALCPVHTLLSRGKPCEACAGR